MSQSESGLPRDNMSDVCSDFGSNGGSEEELGEDTIQKDVACSDSHSDSNEEFTAQDKALPYEETFESESENDSDMDDNMAFQQAMIITSNRKHNTALESSSSTMKTPTCPMPEFFGFPLVPTPPKAEAPPATWLGLKQFVLVHHLCCLDTLCNLWFPNASSLNTMIKPVQ